MLEVRDIKKSFGGVQAVKGSNFSVKEKQVTALIGPNGAGKTTLFDIIGGYLRPDSGKVLFNNTDITKKSANTIANLGVSRTFQQVRLFKYLTILDHLVMVEGNSDTRLFANLFKKHDKQTGKYAGVLEEFGIERGLDALVSELSYGQRKLLDLAMALRKNHDLLMLDEPVAGVNAVVQERIENLLLTLKERGETILLIDHDMAFIRKLADHVVVLDAGSVLLEGKPEEVLKDRRVLEAYLGE